MMPNWNSIVEFFKDKSPYGIIFAILISINFLAYIGVSDVKLAIVGAVEIGIAAIYFAGRKTYNTDNVDIYVQFGNQEPIKLEENIMAYELSANNGFKLEGFTGKDRLGNLIPIEAPELSLSSEGICELRTLTDGSKWIIPVALGDVQLQLKADPIPGPEVGEIFGHFDIKVVTGAAVTVDIIPGPQVPVADIPTE